MKKPEMADALYQVSRKNNVLKIVVSLGLVIFGLLSMASGSEYGVMAGVFSLLAAAYIRLFGCMVGNDRNACPDRGGVKVPSAVQQYSRMDYKTIEAQFKKAGFTNAQCMPLHDSILSSSLHTNTSRSLFR